MCAADGRSSTARRTSSCSKRYASPRPGSSTSRPLRTASSSAPTDFLPALRRTAHGVEIEVRSHHGGELERLVRLRGEPRKAPVDALAHRRRDAESRRGAREPCPVRPDLDGIRGDELPPQLGDEEALPPVSSPIAAVSSVDASAPVVSLTNSRMSSGDNPPSRIRATPSVRYTSTSASASSAGTSASASRNVATSSILASAPERTRWRMSCRLDGRPSARPRARGARRLGADRHRGG